MDVRKYLAGSPALAQVAAARETVWINPGRQPFDETAFPFGRAEVADAAARLKRFAPLLRRLFPETGDGIIESPLTAIPAMGKHLGVGHLFLKRDSDLAVAGSVKARGGIYEVLKHSTPSQGAL